MDARGMAATLSSFFVILFGLMGALFVLQGFVDQQGDDSLEKLKVVFSSNVLESIALVIFLCTIVGLPPSPGFVGKFALIGSAVSNGWYGLAFAAVFAMAVGTLAVFKLLFKLMGSFALMPAAEAAFTATVPQHQSRRERRVLILFYLVPIFFLSLFSDVTFRVLERACEWVFSR
jgi:NADH:ubiquinone oxidoreductase subunit 2 (subunit N)